MEGVRSAQPNLSLSGLPPQMQAILLTTSLLLVAAMLGSLVWLSAGRVPPEAEPVAVESADD